MKSGIRIVLFLYVGLYILGWIIVLPVTHRELLTNAEINLGPPLKIIELSQPSSFMYYLPYAKIKSVVTRPDYTPQRNPVQYQETNRSIVIPVLPFITYYSHKWSIGWFGFGSSGWIIMFHKLKTSEWIS